MVKTIKDEQPRTYFDCAKCPAYCCSIYDRVQVTKRDINRLAKHFGVSYETARRRYTKQWQDERVLKRVKDVIFEETCMFLDQETRGCTIYHARPGVCREYPARSRCAYYDVLQFERRQQDDETVIPVVQITYHEVKKKTTTADGGATEKVWEWEPEKA
ncbi:MAG: YkgJ family cysteine cluster protein [Acidobacteria bacterium]|nr:MAG: YkgJ family cysteine cluster protein [Acidobacteriota bacterium]